jgi:hypothetical protein
MDRSQTDVGHCAMPGPDPTGGERAPEPSGFLDDGGKDRGHCYAPVFEGSGGFVCFFLLLAYLFLLFALYFLLILLLGSRAILCLIRQVQFRMSHCRDGNSDPEIDLNDPYQQHVHSYRLTYGKDAAWEQWMLTNRNRYQTVFDRAASRPPSLVIAFKYYSAPIAYNPPWTSETEHMQALETFAELAYAGYDFQFAFNGDTISSYANVTAGIPTNASSTVGKEMGLYYETIFNHEFGHVMGVWHHYDTVATSGDGEHMPPGETGCIMDRNSNQYCSACRTALFIPLNVDNDAGIISAANAIFSRYPY